MESMARILPFINLIWIMGVSEQYIMTVITVIKFQAGPKLDTEALFWDVYFISYI